MFISGCTVVLTSLALGSSVPSRATRGADIPKQSMHINALGVNSAFAYVLQTNHYKYGENFYRLIRLAESTVALWGLFSPLSPNVA